MLGITTIGKVQGKPKYVETKKLVSFNFEIRDTIPNEKKIINCVTKNTRLINFLLYKLHSDDLLILRGDFKRMEHGKNLQDYVMIDIIDIFHKEERISGNSEYGHKQSHIKN